MIVKIDSSEGTRHTSTATKKESKIMATNFQVLGDTDKAIRALAQRGAVVVLYQGHVAVPKIAPKCPGASQQGVHVGPGHGHDAARGSMGANTAPTAAPCNPACAWAESATADASGYRQPCFNKPHPAWEVRVPAHAHMHTRS